MNAADSRKADIRRYPLCPPRIFRSHNGREFTVPFIVAFIVTMFYYGTEDPLDVQQCVRSANRYAGINIIYPTMINVFYITPTTSRSEQLLLSLPGNIGTLNDHGSLWYLCSGQDSR